MARHFFPAGKVDTRGIPDIGPAGAKDDVARIGHPEMPGQRPGMHRAGWKDRLPLRRSRIITVASLARAALQPDLPGGRQHFLRIDQLARSGDDHIPGYRHPVVEVAIFAIELPAAQEGQRVPSLAVVIDAHPRVPLRDLIYLAVAGRRKIRPVPEVPGHRIVIADLNGDLAAMTRQGMLQPDLQPGIGDDGVGVRQNDRLPGPSPISSW